ncbi:MAG TPA: Kazal-type serine protease inhibitor family protein [Candidatus Paceibacterota bacterium]
MKNLAIILGALVISSVPLLTEARTPVMCTMEYAPVCGTDMKGAYRTYGNSCTLGAEGGTFKHQGECTDQELPGKGYVPPEHCTAWFDGCNSCGRGPDGDSYCTLKACAGDPAPGYCTAYEGDQTAEPKAKSLLPIPGTVATNFATSSIEAATTASLKESFFARIWASIAAWFGGLF